MWMLSSIVITFGLWACVNLAHAAGHILVARKLGVGIDRISIGFGPTIWTRGNLRLALIPVAVFVRLRAPWTPDSTGVWPPENPHDFRAQSLGKRFLTIVAAPLMVLSVAYLASFWSVSTQKRLWIDRPIIDEVMPDQPAARAGLQHKDLILAINGESISKWRELVERVVASQGDPLQLQVQRDTEVVQIEVQPKLGNDDQWRIGVSGLVVDKPPLSILARFPKAASTLASNMAGFFIGIWKWMNPEPAVLSGPIAIAAPLPGWLTTLAERIAVTAAQYFLFCLLLPYLDGRRILFVAIEAITRRQPHPKVEQRYNRIGSIAIGLLVGLGIAVDAIRFALS